jgi:peptidyl-prolyl cis-trans isomerase SurA
MSHAPTTAMNPRSYVLVAGAIFLAATAAFSTAATAAGPGSPLAGNLTNLATTETGLIHRVRSQGIAVLVNDEPITNYEVEQRQRYLGLGASGIQKKAQTNFQNLIKSKSTTDRLRAILGEIIQANPGKSREQILAIFERRKKSYAKSLQQRAVASARKSALPGLRKKALDELIEERLKIQEAKRLNVVADKEEVEKIVKGIAQRNKMDLKQFDKHMKKMGASIYTMKSRFKAMISWRNVVRRQFGHQIAITTRDLDRAIATTDADDKTELNVQRITLLFAKNLGQTELARRLQEASKLRASFTGCSMTGSLAKQAGAARFSNLGPTEASRIPEPTRTMLINASEGEMLPPSVGAGGVELWVLCGRKTVEADKTKRDAAAEQLRQREFQVLAKRHLSDLRRDAHIEYR